MSDGQQRMVPAQVARLWYPELLDQDHAAWSRRTAEEQREAAAACAVLAAQQAAISELRLQAAISEAASSAAAIMAALGRIEAAVGQLGERVTKLEQNHVELAQVLQLFVASIAPEDGSPVE